MECFYRARDMRQLESFVWPGPRHQYLNFERFTTVLEDFSASEPRDRVFAAAQLYLTWNALLQMPALLVSDYRKSILDVYRDVTRFILRHENSPCMMHFGRLLHRSSQDLAVEGNGFASWTIRFDRTFVPGIDPMSFGGQFNAGYKDNITGDDMCLELLDDPDLNLLIIKALLIDTATTTTESFTMQDDNDHARTKGILETLQGWAKQATIAEVLTGSRLQGSGFQFNDSSDRLESYLFFCQYIFTLGSLPPRIWNVPASCAPKERYAAWFSELFINLARNRRFFRTRSGRIGCGPKLMQAGDVVFVMKGAETACILRPVEGKNYWLYVGEAYVHGLMHGEIFDQEEINWEWVKLR